MGRIGRLIIKSTLWSLQGGVTRVLGSSSFIHLWGEHIFKKTQQDAAKKSEITTTSFLQHMSHVFLQLLQPKQNKESKSPAFSSFARRWPSSVPGLRGTSPTSSGSGGEIWSFQRHSGKSWVFQQFFHLFDDVPSTK